MLHPSRKPRTAKGQMVEGSMADEREWLHGERAFRGQPGAAPRGRDRTATRDAAYDAEFRAGGPSRRSGHDLVGYERDDSPREPYGPGGGRGYLRGRGTEYGPDSGHPGLGRGRRSDFYRLHGRGEMEEGRWLDEAARGQGVAGPERHHDGHAASDRSREAGFGSPVSDGDVLESVRENLFQDSYIDPDRIRVQVQRGIVTLQGEVDDVLEAGYARDDAWESPGVRGVVDDLTVRTDLPSGEMEAPRTSGRRQPGR